MKVRVVESQGGERREEREMGSGEVFHLPGSSSGDHNGQGWARTMAGGMSFI